MQKSKAFNGLFPKTFLAITAVMLLLPFVCRSQFYNGSQMSFGRSRVQYKDFFWTYYRFDRFDTYFYLNGKELAVYTAKYAKSYLPEIEKRLETHLDDKISFVIYNSLTDLKQTNIGSITNQQYNTGGITHIVGTKVFLYFDGNHANFEKQIRAGIIRILLESSIYGGTLGSQIKNSTIVNMPDWYINGLVSYLSEDWSTDMDNHVRDAILSGSYKRFNQLTGSDAVYAGHSIWKFIAERYSPTMIPNVIYMTKVSKNTESGFSYALGIGFKELIKDWKAFYESKYAAYKTNDKLPGVKPLLKRKDLSKVYSRLRVSPDARYAAYTTNELGETKIWLYNLGNGKKRKIFKSGFALDEKVDYSYPLLAWHPTGLMLAIILEKKGQTQLYFYTLANHKFTRQTIFSFDKVLDFSYSSDGKMFVMSAVQHGQSDIFVYTIASNSYEQITKDIYDDLYPKFINNSSEILFSSNRTNDTLAVSEKDVQPGLSPNHDLFLYNYASHTGILRHITKTPLADETQSMEYSPGYFSYLSDQNGITNRYLARFDSAITYVDTTTHYRFFTESFPVTDYSRNILDQDINPASGKISEVILANKQYKLYVSDKLLPENLTPLQPAKTPYLEILEKETQKKAEEVIINEKKKISDKRKHFVSVHQKDLTPVPGKEKLKQDNDQPNDTTRLQKQNLIGVNNGISDRPRQDAVQVPGKLLKLRQPGNGEPPADTFILPVQRNYNVEYTINQMVSQIDFSFLNATYQTFTGGGSPIYLNPGTSALINFGVTDLLEDYRITGGVRLNTNLVNNEYLISISNNRGRLDKELVLHRQSVEESTDYSDIRHYTHEAFYILTYPLNQVASIKSTFIYRNDQAVYLSTDYYNLRQPTVIQNWGGVKMEWVYDATRDMGLNLYYGTRYKIFGEYYQLVDKKQKNMVVLGIDYRRYTKIHRTLIWANRFAASTSLGNSKLIYYMGGVDNWLFPKFMQETPIDYSQGYVYQTLATDMRGFNQNIRNGNSFALISSELRFPVFRYFFNRPLKFTFLNNFQVVGFTDIGTAWTGLTPYSNENFLYTKIIKNSPLLINVKVQKEPIVGSYGAGLRGTLFGYFIRADYAWGVEDGKPNKGIFYLSMSLDF